MTFVSRRRLVVHAVLAIALAALVLLAGRAPAQAAEPGDASAPGGLLPTLPLTLPLPTLPITLPLTLPVSTVPLTLPSLTLPTLPTTPITTTITAPLTLPSTVLPS